VTGGARAMTELQIGLLAIGVVVVAGVLAYNRFQERGARRQSDQAFRSTHADALLDEAPRREPVAESPRQSARAEAPQAVSLPDARFDYVMEVTLAAPRLQGAVQERWKAIALRHQHPAQMAVSSDGVSWHALASPGTVPVSRLRAGLQLVTRHGAIGEAELIEFRAAVETLAAALGASVSAPEMRSAVESARELDGFCSTADVQVVLHVVAPAGGALGGDKLRTVAEGSGLALTESGKFALRADDGVVIYTLGARDSSHVDEATLRGASLEAVSLELDLPRTPGTGRAFESMARLGTLLAAQLGGRLEDDNGNVLDERSLGAIASQVEAARAALEARGLAPGSAAALRLFA
jgi:FtsZ-interacting cell division protein ZipA